MVDSRLTSHNDSGWKFDSFLISVTFIMLSFKYVSEFFESVMMKIRYGWQKKLSCFSDISLINLCIQHLAVTSLKYVCTIQETLL